MTHWFVFEAPSSIFNAAKNSKKKEKEMTFQLLLLSLLSLTVSLYLSCFSDCLYLCTIFLCLFFSISFCLSLSLFPYLYQGRNNFRVININAESYLAVITLLTLDSTISGNDQWIVYSIKDGTRACYMQEKKNYTLLSIL